MVRRTSIILMLASALVLTGCLPQASDRDSAATPAPLDLPPIEFTGELEPGACLALGLGQRSDRDSFVPCTEPHRFDVLAVEQWPGMDAAIAEFGEAEVWEKATRNADVPLSQPDEYRLWTDRVCSDAVREMIGWDDLSIGGVTADELWLEPMGDFEVDASLAGRNAFAEGDHRTVCSIARTEAIAFPQGVTIERLVSSGMPIETRQCWRFPTDEAWGSLVDCAEAHTAQMILRFDARAAFGDDFLMPEERFPPEAYEKFYDFCNAAVDAVFDGGDPDFYAWGQTSMWPTWSFDGDDEPFPEWRYFVECGVSRVNDRDFTGDAFDAVARRSQSAGESA